MQIENFFFSSSKHRLNMMNKKRNDEKISLGSFAIIKKEVSFDNDDDDDYDDGQVCRGHKQGSKKIK